MTGIGGSGSTGLFSRWDGLRRLGIRVAMNVLLLAASWCGSTAGLKLRVNSCVSRWVGESKKRVD